MALIDSDPSSFTTAGPYLEHRPSLPSRTHRVQATTRCCSTSKSTKDASQRLGGAEGDDNGSLHGAAHESHHGSGHGKKTSMYYQPSPRPTPTTKLIFLGPNRCNGTRFRGGIACSRTAVGDRISWSPARSGLHPSGVGLSLTLPTLYWILHLVSNQGQPDPGTYGANLSRSLQGPTQPGRRRG